jgi:hypothetical protein
MMYAPGYFSCCRLLRPVSTEYPKQSKIQELIEFSELICEVSCYFVSKRLRPLKTLAGRADNTLWQE